MEEIIKVTSQDEVEYLLEVFTPCFQSFVSGSVNKGIIARKLIKFGIVLKCIVCGTCVAFVGFYCNDLEKKNAFLSLIAVLPDFERMGYGKKLLQQVMEYAILNGMRTLTLEVRKDNDSAIAFYKKQGFVVDNVQEQNLYHMKKVLRDTEAFEGEL